MPLLFVGAGGALGAILRYLLGASIQRVAGSAFPIGTLAVNVTGCLTIGFLGALFSSTLPVRDEWRFFLLVGGLGGFTTFSTFGYETLNLLLEGDWTRAGANVLLSNVLGLLAVWLGYRLATTVQP